MKKDKEKTERIRGENAASSLQNMENVIQYRRMLSAQSVRNLRRAREGKQKKFVGTEADFDII